MRYGYWMPVFGGWLRNVPDEGMEASWDYTKRLTQDAERWGYDLTLIAELNLNDIKGVEQPALDAWSTAAALAAVTETARADGRGPPQFPPPRAVRQGGGEHRPDLGRAAGAQRRVVVVGGRGASNMACSSTSMTIATRAPRNGWTVVDGLWTEERFSFAGQFYQTEDAICSPKPAKRPTVYAGGESEKAKAMIAAQCDAYVMHGDPADAIAPKIADMAARRAARGRRADAIRHGRLCDRPRQRGRGEARARADHHGQPSCPRAMPISTSGCRARSSNAS